LDEFIRLAERTDDLSILRPHADGVREWRNEVSEILRKNKSSKINKFMNEYFSDISSLERNTSEIMAKNGL
jgi:DNA topoisomerase VI subunit B